MSEPRRIGIYGGTFDPVHRTHLDIARAARDFARLDRVLFVVAPHPPHKRGEVFAPAEDRFALVQAAIAGEPGFEASRIEMDRPGLSYTADTLEALHAACPDAALFLIVGADSLADLPGWHRLPDILKHAHLLVAPRGGVDADAPPALAGHYTILPMTPSDVSSTEVRRRAAAGLPIADLTPPQVAERIRQKELYRAGHAGAAH